MTRVAAISAIGWMLSTLVPLYAESAQAASRIVVKPPPHVVVRIPAVRPQQQQSFWGVGTNLQQQRDTLQPTAPHHHRHSRLPESKSAGRKYWSGYDQ